MKEILMKRKGALIIYIIASLMFVIADLLEYSLLPIVVSSIEQNSIVDFLRCIVIIIGVMGINATIFIVSRLLRINYMRNIILDLRMEAFKSIFKQSYKEFAKHSKDIYLSRLINDINRIESQFFNTLVIVISNMGTYIVGMIILFVLDFKLGVGTLFASLVCYMISKQFATPTEKYQEQVSDGNETFTLEMSNTFEGLEIIKLARMEEQFLSKNLKQMRQLEYKKFLYNSFTDIQKNALMFLGYLIMVGITMYLGSQIVNGLPLGSAVFMYQMSSSFAFKLMYSLALINVLKSTENLYAKITQKEVADNSLASIVTYPFAFGEKIELRNLSFSYEGDKVFEHVNLRLDKGGKYMIKGASGTGKSTLMRLLGKMYDDFEGNIVIDDISYKNIDEMSFNKKVAFIDQEIFLFEDTLRNNIVLYQDIKNERLIEVIKSVGLWDFVQENKEGLEFKILENGKNLSGGQRQRIAIARALIKEAEILFVDEGTSSLNNELGAKIESLLLGLPQTVVAISHRYYKGISEAYTKVLEIQGGRVQSYEPKSYFEGVNKC